MCTITSFLTDQMENKGNRRIQDEQKGTSCQRHLTNRYIQGSRCHCSLPHIYNTQSQYVVQCKKCRKDETILSIISAREAHTAGVIMDRLSGDVQAQTTKHGAKDQAEEIDDRQKHLARGGQVLAPVEVEPENTAEPVREPGSEEGSLKMNESEIKVKKKDGKRLTIKLNRLLKTGMASAMIQATVQRESAMATQELTATQSLLWIRSFLLAKMRR